jgi:hypothetical protein
MSYDVMTWSGARPVPGEAAAEFESQSERLDQFEEDDVPPTPAVLAFLADVLKLWPDDDFDAPVFFWSVAPVSPDCGAGDMTYLTMTVHDHLDEMVADIARLAREHGMVAYDPQLEEIIS